VQVLRHFHDDSVKLQAAVDHLIDIGFMSRRDVLRAGGVNMMWGLLLQVSRNEVSCMRSAVAGACWVQQFSLGGKHIHVLQTSK
jgi:hypothetical protein